VVSDVQPHLETERLVLRPPRAEDFDAWAINMADPEASRFIGGPQSRNAAWRGFACMVGSWSLNGFGMFSVIERDSGQWIGRIGPWQPEGWPGTEVGWALAREWWGRGYALEATVTAMDWAFDVLCWQEVIHCIAPDNSASQRLARRLGARVRERRRMPEPLDDWEVDIWVQDRARWQTNRQRLAAGRPGSGSS
jgi:RimJ/RimL family protein N-acetyltransferase